MAAHSPIPLKSAPARDLMHDLPECYSNLTFFIDQSPNPAHSFLAMFRLLLITLALFASWSTCSSASTEVGPDSHQRVQISQLPDRLRIEIDGQLFTEYLFKDVPRPYFYPVFGPGEAAMTRNWPMKTTPNEEHDHPHHRSLWFTHGKVNDH